MLTAMFRILAGVGLAVGILACRHAKQESFAQESYADARRNYIAAVDAVCMAATPEGTAEAPPATPEEEVAELQQAAQWMTRAVAEIEAIAPPERDVRPIRHNFIAPARALAAHLRDLGARAEAAMHAGQVAEARAMVERSLQPNEDEMALRSFAAEYGFQACAGQ